MGAIKDIVDLCIKLRDEVGERKAAEIIGKIQGHTLALQSEQAALLEKNSQLITDNLELKRKVLDMEEAHKKAIAALQEKHRTEISQLASVNASSSEDLDSSSKEILKLIFDRGDEVSNWEVMEKFKMQKSVADYHLDILLEEQMVHRTQYERPDTDFDYAQPALFKITSMGREFVVKNFIK
ncbi:MAG TPA: hypothetical protein VFV23_12260 [Verrucomicrobiae bacterium]|nr:hypothetical protein [Verrucomicrobiae bacterium]